jgi:hypothetical protein
MIYSFLEYLLEELKSTLHFSERSDLRLDKLNIEKIVDLSGKEVSLDQETIIKIQSFYREVLSTLADPKISNVFKEINIPNFHIGLVRLGVPTILYNGEEVFPIFKVYEGIINGKVKMREGRFFWLYTEGNDILTLKLLDEDGQTAKSQNQILKKSAEHLIDNKPEQLRYLEKTFKVSFFAIEDLFKFHSIVTKPGGLDKIIFDLEKPAFEQKKEVFSQFTNLYLEEKPKEMFTVDLENKLEREKVAKEMRLTPNQVWILEWNTKNSAWGAIPILASEKISGPTGNEIKVTLGKKWLHWLPNPVFNPPGVSNTRIIKKGDEIVLAKKMEGNWIYKKGKITEVGLDARNNNEIPHIRTEGWEKVESIPEEEADSVFKLEESVKLTESFKYVKPFTF